MTTPDPISPDALPDVLTGTKPSATDVSPPPFSVVMLAGSLRPSELARGTGLPPLCLPIGTRGTLLDYWLDQFDAAAWPERITIVVNTESPKLAIESSLRTMSSGRPLPTIDVIDDPPGWRGLAGLLYDIDARHPDGEIMMGVEANCLPPRSIRPAIAAMTAGADAVVGRDTLGEASGFYAMTRATLQRVRRVGYADLKEQFLPSLHEAGLTVRAAALDGRVLRLRGRDAYLDAISRVARRENRTDALIDPTASVDSTARLLGPVIVRPGAVIGAGAVVQDSVVGSRAKIADRAIVCRSIIAPDTRVSARARVVDDILKPD